MYLQVLCFPFRWLLERYNLQDIPLTNNPAETSNAIFKGYLKITGKPNNNVNEKKTYEVLLACKHYLESEWQASDLAIYSQGEFEVKKEFKKYLLKKMEDMPHYHIRTSEDIIEEVNAVRAGKLSLNKEIHKHLIIWLQMLISS